MGHLAASVIISTYNQPEWLQKTLWGYEMQNHKNFEIVIADDGSGEDTTRVIQSFQKESPFPVKRVWQEDRGFQKTKILNRAIGETSSEFLIFTDGDCIPRKDFVSSHLALRKQGSFLSGGYFKLPQDISKAIQEKHIRSQKCFDLLWLREQGLKKTFKENKLSATGFKKWALNTFTPTKATWDGGNASGWKNDILAVNGFDERMQYGGEDREMGERLMNLGIRPVQARYSLACLHLFHERPYKKERILKKNNAIRRETKKQKTVFTEHGILKKGDVNKESENEALLK